MIITPNSKIVKTCLFQLKYSTLCTIIMHFFVVIIIISPITPLISAKKREQTPLLSFFIYI